MSWPEYVKGHLRGRTQVELAELVGVSQTAVSRWLRGKQGVDAEQAVGFARAVRDEPVAALVAAEFLTAKEAGMRPAVAPDYSQLSNDELLELVRARMEKGGGERGDRSAATSPQGSGPGLRVVDESDPAESVPDAALDAIEGVDQPPGEPEG